MFFAARPFACVLALVACVTGSPLDLSQRGSSTIIGYRVVKPSQADEYKQAGDTLTWQPSLNLAQLGPGVYTSPDIGQWSFHDDEVWCAILADSTAWEKVNKAWVPRSYEGCQKLWFPFKKTDIPNYLKTLDPSFKASNTVRLSWIGNFEHLQQALIPPELLTEAAGLRIKTMCYPKQDLAGINMINFGEIKYKDWNPKGRP